MYFRIRVLSHRNVKTRRDRTR